MAERNPRQEGYRAALEELQSLGGRAHANQLRGLFRRPEPAPSAPPAGGNDVLARLMALRSETPTG